MIITISREMGANASLVATRVGAALGWRVVDNEIVERVAVRSGLSPAEVAEKEERAPGFLDRLIGAVVRDPEGRRELVKADTFVVALGSYSPFVLSPAGIRVPIYPVKGYSVTVALTHPERAPMLCLSDENAKVAISRLGSRLRAAGTAELTGYDTSLSPPRCDAILARLEQLFPGAGDYARATPWAGLRQPGFQPPATPALARSPAPDPWSLRNATS